MVVLAVPAEEPPDKLNATADEVLPPVTTIEAAVTALTSKFWTSISAAPAKVTVSIPVVVHVVKTAVPAAVKLTVKASAEPVASARATSTAPVY